MTKGIYYLTFIEYELHNMFWLLWIEMSFEDSFAMDTIEGRR